MDIKKYKEWYWGHKSHAKQRNVAWNLSFDEWLKIWIDSGQLENRGRRKNQYCMARGKKLGIPDSGIYESDNVSIILSSDNVRDAQSKTKQPLSEEHKRKIRDAQETIWTVEAIQKEFLKYTSRMEVKKAKPYVYRLATAHGLQQFCQHMKDKRKK